MRTYTYPAAGQPQPHTLQSVSTTGPGGSQTDTYTYGPGGHTTGRTVAGTAETFDWNTEGQLASVTKGADATGFVYDADGNRLIRREPAATTLYLPGGTEVKADNATGTKTGTRYYTHLGDTIAVRTQTALTWLVPDYHNTADMAISSTTLGVTYRRMTPFGTSRGPQVPWQGDRGFVNGTMDTTTGLTHLGAREYDPSTGRFISVDPLVDPNDPQTLNAYAYAQNNPTTHSDPSGKAITLDADGYYHVPSTKPKHRQRAKKVQERHHRAQKAAWLSKREKDLKKRVEEIAQRHDPEKSCLLDAGGGIYCRHRNPDNPRGPQQNEFATCNWLGALKCLAVKDAAEVVQRDARKLARRHGWALKQQNAFQHAYWMVTMRLFGLSEDEARMFAVAHELDHQFELKNNKPVKPAPYGGSESRRDMHNNEVGLRLARTVTSHTPFSEKVVVHYQRAIVDAMNSGDCGGTCLAF